MIRTEPPQLNTRQAQLVNAVMADPVIGQFMRITLGKAILKVAARYVISAFLLGVLAGLIAARLL